MQRNRYLLALGQNEDRPERRRGRQAEYFCANECLDLVSQHWAYWDVAGKYEVVTLPEREHQSSIPTEESGNLTSAKDLYLAAMQLLDRDQLQATWGRIQQQGELDYEQLVLAVGATRQWRVRRGVTTRPVLEEFDGFVDQIDGDIAYVTLKATNGEILYGEYPAAELAAQGIHERRRFKCRTFDMGSHVEIKLERILDREISGDRERAIAAEIEQLLGDEDGPQDDY